MNESERLFLAFQSHSSVLTDDEGAGARFNKNGIENTGAIYAKKKVDILSMRLQLCKESCFSLKLLMFILL